MPGWRRGSIINGCGGVITAVVDVVIIVTKSPRGAWVVLLIIPLLVLLLWSISRYYAGVRTSWRAQPKSRRRSPSAGCWYRSSASTRRLMSRFATRWPSRHG
jgi:ABC-type multidrug transport system fused ATPase/permease subunit